MALGVALPSALDAARAAVDLPGLTPADHRLIGETLLAHGGAERGSANLARYLAATQGEPAALAPLQAQVGQALFQLRRYAAAEPHLRAAAPYDGQAALLLGRTLLRAGDGEAGRREYRAAAERFAGSAIAAEAYLRLGDLALDAGQREPARAAYRGALQTAPATAPAAEAAARLAVDALGSGDVRATLALLEGYARHRATQLRARAGLLLGRSAASGAGRRGRARAPTSAGRWRRIPTPTTACTRPSGWAARSTRCRSPRRRRSPRRPTSLIRLGFWRVDVLRALGMGESATAETEFLRRRFADDPAALALIAREMAPRGSPIAAALLAREAQRRLGPWSESALRVVFPFPYRELVTREARRNGLDPFVVAGLIRQESYFSPGAVSGAGAMGLMQVMPETGRLAGA